MKKNEVEKSELKTEFTMIGFGADRVVGAQNY